MSELDASQLYYVVGDDRDMGAGWFGVTKDELPGLIAKLEAAIRPEHDPADGHRFVAHATYPAFCALCPPDRPWVDPQTVDWMPCGHTVHRHCQENLEGMREILRGREVPIQVIVVGSSPDGVWPPDFMDLFTGL